MYHGAQASKQISNRMAPELYLSCLHLVSLLVEGSGDQHRGPKASCYGCSAAQRMLPQGRGY